VYEKIYIFLKVFLDFPIIKKEQGFEHPNVAWLLGCGSEFLHVCPLHHTAHLERFPVPESINCFKLKKALYGLKQSPREWYNNMNAFLLSIHFKRLYGESCLYYREEDNDMGLYA